MDAAMKWIAFLAAISEPLYALFKHIYEDEDSDPETEYQLALAIIRKAKTEKARKEIEGS